MSSTAQLNPQSMILLIAQNMNSFKKVGYPCHSLHHLLPPYRTSDLRNRGHLFQLPEYTTDLHKKSFIVRTLYKYV